MKTSSLFIILLIPFLAFAQQISNDLCRFARPVFIGEFVSGLTNAEAASTEGETPASQPFTCIKSFENDLWFSFVTEAEFTDYEVVITPTFCNSPAGLQALIIRADGCNAEQFRYRSCANLQNLDTIKMFLHEEAAGLRHFIYVDGYDGTVCDFNLEIKGSRNRTFSAQDYLYIQNEYDLNEEPSFAPESIHARFLNNAVSLSWEMDANADADFFIVSRIIEPMTEIDSFRYAKVVAVMEHQNLVDAGMATYRFTDDKTWFEDGISYCYRITKVDRKGERTFTGDLCAEADMIEDFYVSDVFEAEQANTFVLKYINRKKQDFVFDILNEAGERVKGTVIEKEGKGDFRLDINMQDQPAGSYRVKVTASRGGYFLREFEVE